MAIFTTRYPAKQGISEARLDLARETTMRPGRERARPKKGEKSKNLHELSSEEALVTRRGIEPLFSP